MALYILQNGRQTGPYSDAEIAVRIESGVVAVTDMVWEEGMEDWLPLEEVRVVDKKLADGEEVEEPVKGPPPIPMPRAATMDSKFQVPAPDGLDLAMQGVRGFLSVRTEPPKPPKPPEKSIATAPPLPMTSASGGIGQPQPPVPKVPRYIPAPSSGSEQTPQGYGIRIPSVPARIPASPSSPPPAVQIPMPKGRKALFIVGGGCLALMFGMLVLVVVVAAFSGGGSQNQVASAQNTGWASQNQGGAAQSTPAIEAPKKDESLAGTLLNGFAGALVDTLVDAQMTDAERLNRTKSLIVGVWQSTDDSTKYQNSQFEVNNQIEFRADGTFGDFLSGGGHYAVEENGRDMIVQWNGGMLGVLNKLVGNTKPVRWRVISISEDEMTISQENITWWYRRMR
jgi:hypothetical protein